MLYYSISKIAKMFDITTRTIRYYEEIGLLQPQRDNGQRRMYTQKEYVHLKLILRGKRLGFSLKEIKEMLILFDEDLTGIKQLKKTIAFGYCKLKEVNKQIEELTALKEEVQQYLTCFKKHLYDLEVRKNEYF